MCEISLFEIEKPSLVRAFYLTFCLIFHSGTFFVTVCGVNVKTTPPKR